MKRRLFLGIPLLIVAFVMHIHISPVFAGNVCDFPDMTCEEGFSIIAPARSCTVGPASYVCCPTTHKVNDAKDGCELLSVAPPPPPPAADDENTQTTPADLLDQDDLDFFNPLKQLGTEANADELSTPGGILSRVLAFAFPLGGMILFAMLVWAGWEILMGATDKKSIDAGKQRATAALIGFMLLFVSYWLVQLMEVVFMAEIF